MTRLGANFPGGAAGANGAALPIGLDRPPAPVTLSDDDRAILADEAARTAAANQPKWMLAAGVALVVVAGLYLVAGLVNRTREAMRVAEAASATQQVREGVDRVLAARRDLAAIAVPKDAGVVAKLERLASEAGLTDMKASESGSPRGNLPAGFLRREYRFQGFDKQDGAALLTWLDRAMKEIPGLEVAAIQLTPAIKTIEGKARWKGNIVLSRLEQGE